MSRPVQQQRGGHATSVRVPPPRHPHPPRSAPPDPVRRTAAQPLRASWDPAAEHRVRRRPPAHGLGGFLRKHGWRAYAVPILAVLTALAVLNTSRGGTEPVARDTAAPPAGGAPAATTTAEPTPLVPNPEVAAKFDAAKASAELPAGGPFAETGPGTFTVLPGAGAQAGAGQLFTYSIEIEDGVTLPGGPEGFARTVDSTLANPKSWVGSGRYAFQRVDSGTPKIRVTLASQATARAICGFRIPFDASCWRGGRAVLNAARWERGAVVFQGNVVAYQQYVVNHEVGHALGFGHKPCAENGGLAPIMMQQTWGVANDYLAALGTDNAPADGLVCVANPWPYPTNG
ncbi:MAG TPA: DUF3152 domain-containing protein [Pseudonocardiaceae bacterium]